MQTKYLKIGPNLVPLLTDEETWSPLARKIGSIAFVIASGVTAYLFLMI